MWRRKQKFHFSSELLAVGLLQEDDCLHYSILTNTLKTFAFQHNDFLINFHVNPYSGLSVFSNLYRLPKVSFSIYGLNLTALSILCRGFVIVAGSKLLRWYN